MAEVFLGMPGQWADENRELSDHYTTKVGGIPDWPIPVAVSATQLCECSICRGRLRLVTQVFAPVVSGSLNVNERIIYIFGCVSPECGSSSSGWRVLRIQRSAPSKELESIFSSINPQTQSPSVPARNWWDGLRLSSLEDEDNDIDMEELSRSLTEATKAIFNPMKSRCHQASLTKPTLVVQSILPDHVMPCFYTYALKVPSLKGVNSMCLNYSSLSLKGIKSDSDDSGEGAAWDEEMYEYDRALNADRTYLKFKKQIDVNPEQCFRYSYGGEPVVASGDRGDPGVCRRCGSARQYEMQLMPPLLYFLHEHADDSRRCQLENWNWMTALVYTCSKSCQGPDTMKATTLDGWSIVQEALLLQF